MAGKVKSVTRTAGSTLAALTFGYGAHGHRIWKKNLQTGNTTFYVHDAQGNLMATYEAKPALNSLALSERPIYGSDRLGMDMNKIELYGLPDIRFTNLPTNGPAGLRRYEIKDHLGNVCVTTTGDRYGIDQTPPDGTIDYTMPKVVSWSGYEPFGSLLPGRQFNAGNYRFCFQGQEKDDEVHGAKGTSYAFEYRMHDPRIGRFLSIDPLAFKYPWNSPYAFAENKVIQFIELEGLETAPSAAGSATTDAFNQPVQPANVIPRSDWGAKDPIIEPGRDYTPINTPLDQYYNTIVIHHSGNENNEMTVQELV